jgi:hypothetical protein
MQSIIDSQLHANRSTTQLTYLAIVAPSATSHEGLEVFSKQAPQLAAARPDSLGVRHNPVEGRELPPPVGKPSHNIIRASSFAVPVLGLEAPNGQ